MSGKYWDYSEDKAVGLPHQDDYGDPCSCMSRELTENGRCPGCGKKEEYDLVCGDHGCRCRICKTTFTVP